MKSDLKDCSCLISQMRQVRGDVVKEAGGSGSRLRDFSSPIIKPKGISQQNGGKKECISSKQTEICFVHMGTSSQQHVPQATAEFGAGRGDPVPVE